MLQIPLSVRATSNLPSCVSRIANRMAVPAPFAGAVSGALRLGGSRKNLHQLAPGAAAGAGRTAKNSGGAHSVHEFAIRIGVAGQHHLPLFFWIHDFTSCPR